MGFSGKTFSVLVIVYVGAFITCGANLLLLSTIRASEQIANMFILVWWVEILIIFLYTKGRIFNKKSAFKDVAIENALPSSEENLKTLSQKALDLSASLSQADIKNVESIGFFPINGTGFTIKTPNIKRLAVYMTTKLEKTKFEAEELRNPFDHVVKYIQSDLSKRDFDLIQGRIDEFVKSGGEVKINNI